MLTDRPKIEGILRPLPSMRALEAFVSVAQSGSLSAAATALGMSVAALSRRLQQLEQEVGVPLLQRLARGTVLTPSGERYFRSVNPALDAIRIATTDLKASAMRPTVRVSTISSFARSWLIPRLSRFESLNPHIAVDIHLSTEYVSLDSGEYDVAIRLGDVSRSTPPYRELFPILLFPVCAPKVAHLYRTLKDLDTAQLLAPDHRPEFWPEWRIGVGLGPEDLPSVRLVDSDLIYETAASGLGIAIGVAPIVQPFLEDGRLVRLLGPPVRSKRSFNVLRRASPEPARGVGIFCDWLQKEAERDPAVV